MINLTHKAVVLMCGYRISTQYRNRDGNPWDGGSGKHMYNVINSEGNELSYWCDTEEETCKIFAEHYKLVVPVPERNNHAKKIQS